MTQWRNWYRIPPKEVNPKSTTIACTICGHSEIMMPGERFQNHCVKFKSKEEALEYSTRIYSFAEYLGAFPVGESPS